MNINKYDINNPLILSYIVSIGIYSLVYKMVRFFPFLRKQYRETFINYIGRLLIKIPIVNKIYKSKMDKVYISSQEKIIKQLSLYDNHMMTIPNQGWTNGQIINLIDHYKTITLQKVINKHISGTIYSNSLIKTCEDKFMCNEIRLKKRQKRLFTYAFESSYHWNALHQDEFDIGVLLDYQVVNMVGDMFGGNRETISGIVTSDGSESLMCAMRAYRNFGMCEKGHQPYESVIIALETVHAAIMKAGDAYNIKIVLIPTDEYGIVDITILNETAYKYRHELVAIIGSAPCYCTGRIDPIKSMALIAKKYNCGLHVDCCLDGFIINFLEYDTDFLKIDGVTSLSADTHKNGYAPKGSSVLVTKKMNGYDKYLIEYSIYSIPEWSGGVYGTIKDNGSISSVPALTSLVSMLIMGKETYKEIANKVQRHIITLTNKIRLIDDFIVLNTHNINIVAWKMNHTKLYRKGLIYVLAHEMSKEGVIVNAMKNEVVHFCITHRFIENNNSIDEFMLILNNALIESKKINLSGIEFSGDAGMYCSLSSALIPSKSTTWSLWLENILFGQMGANEAIKKHFMGLLKPFHQISQ